MPQARPKNLLVCSSADFLDHIHHLTTTIRSLERTSKSVRHDLEYFIKKKSDSDYPRKISSAKIQTVLEYASDLLTTPYLTDPHQIYHAKKFNRRPKDNWTHFLTKQRTINFNFLTLIPIIFAIGYFLITNFTGANHSPASTVDASPK